MFRVTVQIVVAPDNTATGEQLSADGTIGAMRLRVAPVVVPFKLAVSTAVLSAVTADTEAAKLAPDAPAATVTDAGVETRVLLSVRATTAPPAGADAFRVTAQVEVPLPVTAEGVQISEDNPIGAEAGTVTRPPVSDVVMLSPTTDVDSALEI